MRLPPTTIQHHQQQHRVVRLSLLFTPLLSGAKRGIATHTVVTAGNGFLVPHLFHFPARAHTHTDSPTGPVKVWLSSLASRFPRIRASGICLLASPVFGTVHEASEVSLDGKSGLFLEVAGGRVDPRKVVSYPSHRTPRTDEKSDPQTAADSGEADIQSKTNTLPGEVTDRPDAETDTRNTHTEKGTRKRPAAQET